ncbi:hypothetical protein AB0G45_32845, partial [Streptomyces sp. NPDC021139]
MSDPNKDTSKKPTSTRTVESKARDAAEKTTAPAARAGQGDHERQHERRQRDEQRQLARLHDVAL